MQQGFGEQEVMLASGAGMSPGLCAQGGSRVQMCPPGRVEEWGPFQMNLTKAVNAKAFGHV